MRYCKNCLLPDTRPNLKIEINGICDACLKDPNKTKWNLRLTEFKNLVNKIKKKKEPMIVLSQSEEEKIAPGKL